MALAASPPDLWGRILLNEEELFHLIYNGAQPEDLAAHPSDAVTQFNTMCRSWGRPEQQIGGADTPDLSPEQENARRIARWRIPEPFDNFDVRELLLALCSRDEERDRINMEMDIFEERGLTDLLRMMCALVAHFRQNNVVWGVGRGSSVASYSLFLIGVHKVDSLRYGLDFAEFIKPEDTASTWCADHGVID